MRNRWAVALAVFALAAVFCFAQHSPSGVIARKAFDLMLAENYTQLRALFDPKIHESIPEETLRTSLGPPLRALGHPVSIAEPVVTHNSAGDQVVIRATYLQGVLRVDFTVTRAGKIAEFHLHPDQPATPDQPSTPYKPAAPATWTSPPYSQPDRFRVRQFVLGSSDPKLPGTALIPIGRGPFPALILVQGSGPLDRDETIGINKPLRDIAEGLASRGIIVMRYDKRTKALPPQSWQKNLTLQLETVDDALRAVTLVRTLPQADGKRVFVLGHGLGGYAAPRIAKADGRLAGLIILGATVRPPEQSAIEMRDYPPGYWLDLKGYNPAVLARTLPCRLLILQGDRDFEVPPNEISLWRAALAGKSNASFHNYLALNHLFIVGEGVSSPEEYKQLGHVSQNVIVDIAFWITS